MAATSGAVKALSKQFKELHDHPLYCITAAPNEDNILNWCGNVFFPENSAYPGLVLHFHLSFDQQYPSTSPKLSLCTTINHTHVFGSSCCFSLLPDFAAYFDAIKAPKSAYWNPARTVRSFLEGFFQFLVYDVDRESHGRQPVTDGERTTAITAAKAYTCTKCGHTTASPKPARPDVTEADAVKYQEEDGSANVKDMSDVDKVAADLSCSVSRMTINETIMGFGVNVVSGRNGPTITTDLFPLSYESFYNDKIRVSAGGMPITHWIPFAINEQNWKKAAPVAEESISLISVGRKDGFKVDQVFEVIGELWKTKAVEMMKGEEFASEKVLIGFCAFHHLLLAFAQSYPQMIAKATEKVKTFIQSPMNRNKKACPDFGRFLPVFLLSDVLWEDETHAGRVCVSELFTRNAMWIIKAQPGLANDKTDGDRVKKSWEPSQVGLKLTCFQIRYILEVGRPLSEKNTKANWERFNLLLGRPTAAMIEEFQKTTKKVQAISNYKDWFAAMGLGQPPDSAILSMLQEAVVNSKKQGYHK